MKSIYDLTLEQLKEELKAMGQKPFRAKQIYEWIYVKNVYDFHQMTNLSKELQETLSNHFSDALLTIKEKQVARDGTTKYLLELEDGGLIEDLWSFIMCHKPVRMQYGLFLLCFRLIKETA